MLQHLSVRLALSVCCSAVIASLLSLVPGWIGSERQDADLPAFQQESRGHLTADNVVNMLTARDWQADLSQVDWDAPNRSLRLRIVSYEKERLYHDALALIRHVFSTADNVRLLQLEALQSGTRQGFVVKARPSDVRRWAMLRDDSKKPEEVLRAVFRLEPFQSGGLGTEE
ncbi:hypothetical protein GCM10011571_10790 [Marinithermofilum abyssi]|uniref:Uncharacterized protein n=1 Tax=Marinithermofilum abyssi TaxID=1571185 RepID=A0A8J2VER7_9BACL|nr:hypothetical protein [Marinithermofilum abyssi]GGE11290.1 hypothetical protein GCM10011571_10790 [Marinithermofilum abyssi]